MLWRHLCLVRAFSAAGLVGGMMMLGGSTATAQAPSATPAAARTEPSAPPADVATETVDLLQAGRSGDLAVVTRGHGQDKVKMSIRNNTRRRLNVIVPPGLVAASKVAQGRGGGGGGGGMQSIGLGSVANRPGAFGEFQGDAPGGLRSIPTTGEPRSRSVTVPAGEVVDVTIPGVCLNYGVPAPTPRDSLILMDVNTYTTNPRIRKALRSLATMGTSQGVAQAVMWRVCDDLPYETMLEQVGKVMNASEIALAARFVEALDESSASDLVEPSALTSARILVQVEGQGALAREAARINGQLDGLRVLGLPVKAVEGETLPPCSAPALAIRVVLTNARPGEIRGRIVVNACSHADAWSPLGSTALRENSSISVVDGPTMARALDRAVSGAFVSVKPSHRSVGSTTLKVENRLPFTISGMTVRAGNSSGAPSVPFEAIGVGPERFAQLPIQAATASLVEHVELNGL